MAISISNSVAHPSPPPAIDDYLVSRRQAWFAFAMTFALMLFDYTDRQVIVSIFPYLKAEWLLSDKQLGGLVSIVSIVVGVGGIPVALVADRVSRVKSIAVMATTWSLATIACMWTGNYAQLFTARAVVGAGETGYGSVGAALVASVFPQRMRSTLMGSLFAAASLGSVLGVLLGGTIAAHYGWKAAFGAVGVPGLVLALLYLFVRDYKTVALTAQYELARRSTGGVARQIVLRLWRTPTLLWICLGSSCHLIFVSTIWSWLPSYLNRYEGIAPQAAAKRTALVVLIGAVGVIVWSHGVDRLSRQHPSRRLTAIAALCLLSMVLFLLAFAGGLHGTLQFQLIMAGAFLMTCISGPVSAVVIDVTHPGVRSTGAAVFSLFQNLFGLAVGPFLAGVLSDLWGLQTAMDVLPLCSALGAAAFLWASRSYVSDRAQVAHINVQAAAS